MSLADFGHRLVPAFIAFLGLLCALPRIHGHPVLLASVGGMAVLMGVWHFVLARSGAKREILPNLKPNHYVQLVCHLSIYIWWGTAWPQVGLSAPLIAAEVAFAYLFEMAFAWTRGKPWRSGFGPIPITLSMNLFLWFKDDWFYWQFAMLALAFIQKDAFHWTRDGIKRHIFNPSAFALSVAALILIPFDLSYTTWGEEIATTLAYPANIYVVIFALGLIVHFRFPIVLMTMSAVAGCVLFQWLHWRETGNHLFVDATVPIAVFLGMNFLFTDPMTSPRTTLGKLLFGFLYGSLVVFEYKWLSTMGRPAMGDSHPVNVTYFDKLIQVPLLNLMVPALDYLGKKVNLERFRFDLTIPQVRYGFLAAWIPIFWFGFLPGFVDHPGKHLGFWSDRCADSVGHDDYKGDPKDDPFCKNFALFLMDGCKARQPGWDHACNTLGTLYEDGVGVQRNDPFATQLHATACDARYAKACTDLGNMALEGRGGPVNAGAAKDFFRQACDAGDADGCQNLGTVLARGAHGNPAVLNEARALLARALMQYEKDCKAGTQDACDRLQEIRAATAPPAAEAAPTDAPPASQQP
jgi:hypothetical protein